jgi:membrane-associated phospholipid phosphatase
MAPRSARIRPFRRPIQDETAPIHGRLIAVIFGVYLALAAILTYVNGGAFITPDTIMVLLGVGAVILGRGRSFVRDWAPFLLLLFGYELMRGFADYIANVGDVTAADHGSVQVASLLHADEWLFRGHLPTTWLQDRLYTPGVVHWYDVGAALIYLFHFLLPLVFGFMLWLRNKEWFRRFTLSLLAMSYGAFFFYFLMPSAPPWLAQQWGYLDNVQRPSEAAYELFLPARFSHVDTFQLWTHASPNPVAAFPSLHAAFPWLVLLFAVRCFGKWGWLMLIYNAALWFSVVYLSQHWVVDVIAGIVWATAAFYATEALWRWAVSRAPIPPSVVAASVTSGDD